MLAERIQPERPKEPYHRLAEINRAITTSLNFDQVLNLIVQNAAQLVDATACLLLLENNNGVLGVRASLGVHKNPTSSFSCHLDDDVNARLRESFDFYDGHNLFSTGIIAKHSPTGLLVVVRPSPLEPEEQWQLRALADQAAIALRNARLYEMKLAEANRERFESLEALQESNLQIKHILESTTDLFYSLDTEWRFVDVNRQTEIRFGKTRGELIGRAIWDVFPAAVDSLVYSRFHEAVSENSPIHFELFSKIVEGAWFEAHVYPSITGISVHLRDITERKAAEVMRQLLSSIVESSDDAIISKNLDGIINSWNKGAERVFGYTAQEALGRPGTMLMPPDRFDEEPAILDRIRSGRLVDHYETVRRRKDSALISVSVTVSPIKDEQGNIIGASKIARDITEQKQAQNEINFQARLLSAVQQAVVATDRTGVIAYLNTFAESLFGWTAEDAIGKNIVDLAVPSSTRPDAWKVFERVQNGQSWSGEMIFIKRDGGAFPAMVTHSPIFNPEDELIGTVLVSVDISNLKLAEQERTRLFERERAARAQAESANRLKDEFLATLSHELRNPLNVVIGYSEILRRSDNAQNAKFVARAADIIRRNALAQSQLVSDLLDLSRLQMGKLGIDHERVDLSTIVKDGIETIKDEATAKDIKVELDIVDKPLIVLGDPVRLRQITWNLLNNAVKFTSSGGVVRIMLSEENGNAQLSVSDNGQGIAPEFLPHVFQIFRQADASSARRQGGLGIGLALVKRLAELHAGGVKAESKGVGAGATFTVTLPLHNDEGYIASPAQLQPYGVLDGRRILVVDDSSETTEMLSRLLQLEGATVETARSGAEALSVAADSHFDLVISDISMPEMDGYQLLHKLRALPDMSGVPTIALTGFGRRSDIERAHYEGFARHFTKPLDIDALLKAVTELT
ncbi:MAG: PAS domain S-box protein [Pyrinomonadaceae bacterium]